MTPSPARAAVSAAMRVAVRASAFAAAAWLLSFPATADRRAGPPEVVAFSPAAAHAGDPMLIDARYDGHRPPRVAIGGRRVARRHVRVEAAREAGGAHDDGVRRVWARIPERLAAGAHEVRIATRRGTAAAAKPIVVASCREEPTPTGCGGTLASGVSLRVTGTGYDETLSQPGAVDLVNSPTQTLVGADFGPIHLYTELVGAPGSIQVGDASIVNMVIEDFTGGFRGYWDRGAGEVSVVEVSPTRVRICIDTVLEAAGVVYPTELHVQGYLVFKR